MDTARRAAQALDKVVRRDDGKAYDTMIKRGIELVDTGPYRAEWDKAADETIDRLTGRIFSKSLLAEVRAAAGGASP